MSNQAPTVNQMRGNGVTAGDRLRRVLRARETGVLVALLLMCLFLWQATPAFLTVRNLLNIGRQVSLIGIMATLGVLLAAPAFAGALVWRFLAPHLPLAVTALLILIVGMLLVVLEWLGLARLLGRALDKLEPSDIPSVQS